MANEIDFRSRIVGVLAKYNVKLADAPLDALAMAMARMVRGSLLRPATSAPPLPPVGTPEHAAKTRENADYYRETLKPFA